MRRESVLFGLVLIIAVICISALASGCAMSPPQAEKIAFSEKIVPLKGDHWVLFRLTLDPISGSLLKLEGANTKDPVDCLNKAVQSVSSRSRPGHTALQADLPAHAYVCRHVGPDGMPLDEDKIDDEGAPLPKDDSPRKRVDPNTV